MTMTQIVLGAALGFLIGEGVLLCIKRLIAGLRHEELRAHIRTLAPSSGRAIAHASVKYAVLAGAGAALITLGVWAFGDYFATRSARSATASDVEPQATLPLAASPASPQKAAELAPSPGADDPEAVPAGRADPYADPDFKVQRHVHRAGKQLTLKETLVQRAEAKARAELLAEVKDHRSRSQYDCEAADRAARYVRAGLDVWGFSAWQVKHFPMDGYDGATLPGCQQIKALLDPSRFDLHDAVAQGNGAGAAPRGSRSASAANPAGEAGKSQP